jgi:hypothetical protein
MSQIIVALVGGKSDVLDFATVDTLAGTAILEVPDDMSQDDGVDLAMTLQTLLDAGDIRGWGRADDHFVVEGKTYTLAEMVAANVTEDDDYDWITSELLAISSGGVGQVGMLIVHRL